MNCPNCGRELKEGLFFCPGCGVKLDTPQAGGAERDREKEPEPDASAPQDESRRNHAIHTRIFRAIQTAGPRAKILIAAGVIGFVLITFVLARRPDKKEPPRARKPVDKCKKGPCPPDMCYIPSGAFRMGCSEGDHRCDENELPSRLISITTGFCMDQFEVTQDAYEEITGETPALHKGCGGNCPVETVFWEDADDYCRALGGRLPTEAEWEYAARGGASTAYYWGDSFDGSYEWYSKNSKVSYPDPLLMPKDRIGPHPVGSKKQNGFGLYDIAGNVTEWILDCYDEYFYEDMDSDDPFNDDDDCKRRVYRGGAYSYGAKGLRISRRAWQNHQAGSGNHGFRCMMDISE